MQTAPWLGLVPGADGQILHSQDGGNSPIVNLFKSAAAAAVSNPECQYLTSFNTMSKQSEAAGNLLLLIHFQCSYKKIVSTRLFKNYGISYPLQPSMLTSQYTQNRATFLILQISFTRLILTLEVCWNMPLLSQVRHSINIVLNGVLLQKQDSSTSQLREIFTVYIVVSKL